MSVLGWYCVILLSVLCHVLSASQNETGYINCTQGTLNVILAATHGGPERPADIPDRAPGCYVNNECVYTHDCGIANETECDVSTLNDLNTKELTEQIASYLEESTGRRPYTIINNLARIKLDANREVNEAAFGVAIATQAYEEFQQCIQDAKDGIQADTEVDGRGLFLDIHGHGHPNNWAELGYLLSRTRLDNNDITASSTSIYHLSTVSNIDFESLLRGNVSFGYFLEQEGYVAVPSPTHLGPNGESYFSGGYNTKTHGSRDGGTIDGIQIESSSTNRADGERDNYARALANTVVNFMQMHYPMHDAQTDSTTDTSVSNNETGYINCTHGTLNVILAAPHGGYEHPVDIPDRTAGCYVDNECVYSHDCGTLNETECDVVTENDLNTKELTEQIAHYLKESTGRYPHIVINNLARIKLDANREVNEAAFSVALATQAYEEFQQCIQDAKDAIEEDSEIDGRGLFFDIHGHGHPNNWAELGYLLSSTRLDNNDTEASSTSIYHLSTVSSIDFETLLRGNVSFGYFLEHEGYVAVPSPTHSGPNGESYFSGGYNTKTHGSRDGGTIDGIQIESSYTNRADLERDNYARALANAIINFMQMHYPMHDTRTDIGDDDTTESLLITTTQSEGLVVLPAKYLALTCLFIVKYML